MFTQKEFKQMSEMTPKKDYLPHNNMLDGTPIGKHITFYKQWSRKKKRRKRYKKLPHRYYVFFVDDFFMEQNDELYNVYWDKQRNKFVVGEDPDSCGWWDFGKGCSFKTLKKAILSWNIPVGVYVRIWGDLNVVAAIKK